MVSDFSRRINGYNGSILSNTASLTVKSLPEVKWMIWIILLKFVKPMSYYFFADSELSPEMDGVIVRRDVALFIPPLFSDFPSSPYMFSLGIMSIFIAWLFPYCILANASITSCSPLSSLLFNSWLRSYISSFVSVYNLIIFSLSCMMEPT